MSSTELAKLDAEQERILEQVVVGGNIAALKPQERTMYYRMRCDAAGLDWRTQPFLYVTLQGKLTLYATKNCSEQLCQTRSISTAILDEGYIADGALYRVKCKATTPDGRYTEDLGVVSLWKAGRDGGGSWAAGEDLANCILKATTKAKRRAILGHCGMGMMDETEAEDIPGAVQVDIAAAQAPAPQAASQPATEAAPAVASQAALDECESKRLRAIELGFKVAKTGKEPQPIKEGATAKAVNNRIRAYDEYIEANTKADEPVEAETVEAEAMDLDGTDYVERLSEQYQDLPQYADFIQATIDANLPFDTNGDVVKFEQAYLAQYDIPVKANALTAGHWAELAKLIEGEQFKW